MQVNLVFLKKDGTTNSFTLPSSVTTIGRRQDCDFCIPLMVVSRRHCEINMDAGKTTIRDLGSRNGTFVNGEPIEEVRVKAGDVLKVGPVEFVIQIDGVPDDFTDYFRQQEAREEAEKKQTPEQFEQPEPAAEEKSGQQSDKLGEPELGGSQTELLGDIPDDFDLSEGMDL